MPEWNAIDKDDSYALVERIFGEVIMACGVTDYVFHRSDTRSKNHIEIRDIKPLLALMDHRSFAWAKVFEGPAVESADITDSKIPANDRIHA